MDIHEILCTLITELGIMINSEGEFVDLHSITFMSMIVQIEETFSITFPDDLLNMELINSMNTLEIIVKNIVNGVEQNEVY